MRGAKRQVGMALVLGLLAGTAAAEGKLTYGTPGGQAGQYMEIGQSAVRMSQGGQAQWMLYREAEKALYIVDDGQKSYQKVDREMIDSLKRQIDAMRAQIDAQMAQLPPAQREMMRGMMPQVPDFSPAEYTIEMGDGQREVAGFQCRPLIVKENDTPVEEMCLASVEELKLTRGDLKLLQSMGQTMGDLAASFGAGSMAAVMKRNDGVPVEHRKPGEAQPRSVLLKVDRGAQPAERFKLPSGYTAKPLYPGMPQ